MGEAGCGTWGGKEGRLGKEAERERKWSAEADLPHAVPARKPFPSVGESCPLQTSGFPEQGMQGDRAEHRLPGTFSQPRPPPLQELGPLPLL